MRRTSPRRWRWLALALASALLAGGATLGSSPASAQGVTYTVTLTLSPRVVDGTAHSHSTATATVTSGGIPQPAVTVTFNTDGDETFQPSTHTCQTGATTGACTVTVVAGGTQFGTHHITASASSTAGTGGPVSATLLAYKEPVHVAVAFRDGIDRVAPNGVTSTIADIHVTDDNGIPLPTLHPVPSTNVSAHKVTFSAVQDDGAGNYETTITSPVVFLDTPPTWTGSSEPDQTITAAIGTFTGSSVLKIAPPTLQTVQTPSPNPGLYDDFGRAVRLSGLNGVFLGRNNRDDAYSASGGGDLFHMPGSKFLQFDPTPGDHPATTPGPGYSWNASIVRLQLGDELWCATDALCTSPADNPSLSTTCGGQYQQYVQGIIDTITRLGMVALVDLAYVPALSVHTATALTCNNAAGQLDQAQGGLTPSQRAMADFAYAPTFWHQLAAQNANNPLVAFDLFNEPDLHNGRPDCGNDSNGQPVHQGRQTIEPASDPNEAGTKPLDVWLNAGLSGTGEAAGRVEDDSGDQQLTDGKMGYQAAGMQLLYNTVRSVAQRNLVFVSGVGVERDDQGVAVDCFENAAYDLSPVLGGWAIAGGTNVVYGTHPYYGSNCSTSASGTSGDGTIPGIPSGFPPNLQGAVYDVAQQYPVAFTEFGSACATDSTAAMFNQGIAADATAPANHIVGWIAHQFVAKYQEQNSADHTKDGPPFYLFQCLMGKPGDCNLGTNGATKNYQYYEPSQRGQPVYDGIPAAPALR